jgi:protein farnesyltransferase subunit beta
LHIEKTTLKPVELFNRSALQNYVFSCCQDSDGGLKDKPEKFDIYNYRRPDYYHTCYCLAGLSLCQSVYTFSNGEIDCGGYRVDCVLDPEPKLKPTHPIHNIRIDAVHKIKFFFA